MTPKEMIEVLQAFERGEKIEYFNEYDELWLPAPVPVWSFNHTKYRIAKPEPKKVKLYAHVSKTNSMTYFYRVENYSNTAYWRAPHLDFEVEE